ncbi:MAG: hypothetical protein M3R50_13115 [Bacteroidota bacterium]|nr:hypothetical protein [Bacteroidota bacterium]
MKKLFFSIIAFCCLNVAFAFSGHKLPTKNASQVFIPIGKNMQISLMDLSVINVKDFQQLTGKHLNLFQRMSFKASQKKLRNSFSADGTIDNANLKKLVESGSGGFNIGGFALGFFLGIIGVLIAYLINSDNKQNLTKWAWIGFGVWVVLIILFII